MADRWNKDELAESRYIWLPISFAGEGSPQIRWQDEWSSQPLETRRLKSNAFKDSLDLLTVHFALVLLKQMF